MGCNCGKRKQVVLNPKPVEQLPQPPVTLVEEIDWYNNIDMIEPIMDKVGTKTQTNTEV